MDASEYMKSRAYECEICGMVFVNSKELSEHQTNVHIRKMYQCQSCNQVFSSKQHFEKHEAQAHSATANLNSLSVNESSKHRREQGMESHLLDKMMKQERAHKRSRGPYRKSHQAYNIKTV